MDENFVYYRLRSIAKQADNALGNVRWSPLSEIIVCNPWGFMDNQKAMKNVSVKYRLSLSSGITFMDKAVLGKGGILAFNRAVRFSCGLKSVPLSNLQK